VRPDAAEAALEQLDQPRTLNGEEAIAPLPADKFASNAAADLLVYPSVDVRPATLSCPRMQNSEIT